MSSYEDKIMQIFHTFPQVSNTFDSVIWLLYHERSNAFRKRWQSLPKEEQISEVMRVTDIQLHDYYFDFLRDRFMSYLVKNRAQEFTSEELKQLKAESESHLDFYEVSEVFPGKGSRIASVFTGKEFFLKDINSSHIMDKWDISLTRCFALDGIYYATGSASVFSPRDKDYIRQQLFNAQQKYQEETGNADYAAFAKDNWPVFGDIQRAITEARKNIKLMTPYGELVFCELVFAVKDVQVVLNKLSQIEDFDLTGQEERPDRQNPAKNMLRYTFDWLEKGPVVVELDAIRGHGFKSGYTISTSRLDAHDGDTGVRSLGTVYLDRQIMRLKVNSLELAEFAKKRFGILFPTVLKFKRIQKTDLKQAMEKTHAEQETVHEAEEIPDRIKKKLLKQLMEKITMETLDKPIPMLGNLTPRQASKDPKARAALTQWLNEIENMEAKKRRRGDYAYPIEKLRKELGIEK
jgi:hypothetical protein